MQKPTKKELSQFRFLKHEIESKQKLLKELESSFDSSSAEITGMPRCGATVDTVGTYVTEIDALKSSIGIDMERCLDELIRLYQYIESVKDSQMRWILLSRFVNGFSWGQIAACIGGGNTADSVRVMVDRFFKKY